MFDFKTNVSCVLESIFAGFKDENIKMAADKITELHTDELESLKTEIKEWYWQADKQKLSEDPCVVDAMIDLFIRTVKKYIAEPKGEDNDG